MLDKAIALGMTEAEYNKLLEILGRVPSTTELAMVSVEWSEHCGYPRSRALLKMLPKDGHYASVAGADTGGIEVEPGLFVVFKWSRTTIRHRWNRVRAPQQASAASSAIFSQLARVPLPT
jgi:phosphoribosylformylglycinamidine (FGAM) synthase-like enzyme